ncbi:MAG: type II secretion system F family protein [Candidatus Omnitrophota bacterium]
MVIPFTRQLYTLIKTGIPLLKALQIIVVQLPVGKFRASIEEIIQNIQQGKSFSESLSTAPHFFSLLYINMIKAAEVSGNLTEILRELSQHLIESRRVNRQVQAALMYPILVLIIASVILIGLLMFVLPVFMRIFEDIGGTLPPTTLFLIAFSKFIQHWGWLFVVLLAILAGIVFIISRKPYGKRLINIFLWRLPLFGKLTKTMEIGRFCRTMGTLLSSGVTLTKTMNVLYETTPAVLLQNALDDIRYQVEQGKSLSAAMEETGLFPLTLVRMIQVGEESGKIAELFLDIAQDYEEEVSFSVTGLLSMLEPLLIVVMGVIVGFIVVSLFFPIFTLSGVVK